MSAKLGGGRLNAHVCVHGGRWVLTPGNMYISLALTKPKSDHTYQNNFNAILVLLILMLLVLLQNRLDAIERNEKMGRGLR